MAGKAIFTAVSSCVSAVPSPIMATCQGFAWSRPADEWGGSLLEIEVTLKSRLFAFIPAINIHARKASHSHPDSCKERFWLRNQQENCGYASRTSRKHRTLHEPV
jgi:hypothetical protein